MVRRTPGGIGGLEVTTKEAELRRHRCCFTGHRPEKLTRSEAEIKKDLEAAILQAIDDGFMTFITGMARDVDIWAGEIVLRLRKTNVYSHIKP